MVSFLSNTTIHFQIDSFQRTSTTHLESQATIFIGDFSYFKWYSNIYVLIYFFYLKSILTYFWDTKLLLSVHLDRLFFKGTFLKYRVFKMCIFKKKKLKTTIKHLIKLWKCVVSNFKIRFKHLDNIGLKLLFKCKLPKRYTGL